MERDELLRAMCISLERVARSTSPMVRADTELARINGNIEDLRRLAELNGEEFKLSDEEDDIRGELMLTRAGAYTKTIKL